MCIRDNYEAKYTAECSEEITPAQIPDEVRRELNLSLIHI